MNIKDVFLNKQASVNQTAFGLMSLREYYQSARDKIISWVGNAKEVVDSQTVSWVDEEQELSHEITVSLDTYHAMVQDPFLTKEFFDAMTEEYIELSGAKVVSLCGQWPEEEITSGVETIRLVIDHNGQQIVTAITNQQYLDCINERVSSITASINNVGDTVLLSREEVLNRIEELSAEISVQEEFLSYCLDNEVTSSTDFMSRALAGFNAIPKDTVRKYADLLTSGDPLQAIQSFLNVSNNQSYQMAGDTGHEYIQIVEKSDYTGVTVLDIIWTKVTATLQAAWDGIVAAYEKSASIFVSLFEGVKAGTMALLKLVGGRFFTRYTNGSRSLGIIDCPIMQLTLGRISDESWANLGLDSAISGKLKEAQRIFFNERIDVRTDINFSEAIIKDVDQAIPFGTVIYNALGSKDIDANFGAGINILRAISEEIDGIVYTRPIDVFLPSRYRPDVGLILRVGPVNKGEYTDLMLQVYPFIPKGWQESFENDRAVYLAIRSIFSECLGSLGDCFPVLNPIQSGSTITPSAAISNVQIAAKNFMSDLLPSETDNVDIVSHFKVFDDATFDNNYVTPAKTSQSAGQELSVVMRIVCGGFIPYILSCLCSQFNSIHSIINVVACLQWDYDDYYISVDNTKGWTESFTTPSVESLSDVYASFIQRGLTPVAVHYQTVTDMTQEIVIGVGAMLLAATAIFIGVKYHKFKRNLRLRTEVATGYADNMSWTMGANPTKDQMKAYSKARRKSDRLQKISSKFGLTTTADSTTSLMNIIGSVKDSINNYRGIDATKIDQDLTAYSFLDVLKLISLKYHN